MSEQTSIDDKANLSIETMKKGAKRLKVKYVARVTSCFPDLHGDVIKELSVGLSVKEIKSHYDNDGNLIIESFVPDGVSFVMENGQPTFVHEAYPHSITIETTEKGAIRVTPEKPSMADRMAELEYKRKIINMEILHWSIAAIIALIVLFAFAIIVS